MRPAPERRIATLALSKSELNSVAFCSKGAGAMRQKFSVEVPTLEVTNQKASGRCWLFAATNVLRERIAQTRNLENFELSQSYLAFWDKFERCNYFLESILETADLPDERPHRDAHSFHRRARRRPSGICSPTSSANTASCPRMSTTRPIRAATPGNMERALNRALKVAAAKLQQNDCRKGE